MTNPSERAPAPSPHPTRSYAKAHCHPERLCYARGLCKRCYSKVARTEKIKQYRDAAKKRYWRNRDKNLAKAHEFYQNNLEHVRERSKRWAARNQERVRAYRKKYWASLTEADRVHENTRHRKLNDEVRKKAFALYGSKCCRCSFSDWRALQFDHINGGGRKEKTKRGAQLSARILSGKEPKEKFQLLCANCNWIKRWERGEGCKAK